MIYLEEVTTIYTVAEAAAALGLTRQTILLQIGTGKIEAIRAGTQYLIREQAVERYRDESLTKEENFIDGREALTIAQAALEIGVVRQRIHHFIKHKRLMAVRKGRLLLIARDEVERFKKEREGEA